MGDSLLRRDLDQVTLTLLMVWQGDCVPALGVETLFLQNIFAKIFTLNLIIIRNNQKNPRCGTFYTVIGLALQKCQHLKRQNLETVKKMWPPNAMDKLWRGPWYKCKTEHWLCIKCHGVTIIFVECDKTVDYTMYTSY